MESSASSNSQLKKLLAKYTNVFKEGIGKLRKFTAKIKLKANAKPVFMKARSVPFAIRGLVDDELARLVKEDILESVEHSEWATPIVPVIKPDRTVRICGDFKQTLNPVIERDEYPLPKIDEAFAKIAGGQKFSKLDVKHAYLHMPMDTASRALLTINTPKGLFRYKRMVFGLSMAPAVWQRTMEEIFKGIDNIIVFLDDILVTGKTDSEHLDTLEQVIRRLEEYDLRLNLNKCQFFLPSVTYCGFKIDKHGLHKTSEKIEAICKAPAPKNVTEVKAFTGLVNYYARFLPNLATTLYPINQLLHKNQKFVW
ncbi:hypothetical protein B4U79_15076, partial [Dinothrombium tinctorium]